MYKVAVSSTAIRDLRKLPTNDRNTLAIVSPPRRGSGVDSICSATWPDPGKTTKSVAAFVAPFFLASYTTSAASRRSSYPPLVHDPM